MSSTNTIIEILPKDCFDVWGGQSENNLNEELSKNMEHSMISVLSKISVNNANSFTSDNKCIDCKDVSILARCER